MIFNSNSTDTVSWGDVSFNLTRYINLPNNVIGYVRHNEFIIPNTNYSINTSNNTLVLQDYAGASQSFTIQVGNYTVSTLMSALNSAFVQGVGNYQSIIVIILMLQVGTLL